MIRDNAIGHLRAAMKLEPVTLTSAPITLIPALSASSTQTQYGTIMAHGDGGGKPSNALDLSFEREDLATLWPIAMKDSLLNRRTGSIARHGSCGSVWGVRSLAQQ